MRDPPVTGQHVACSFASDYKSLAELRRDAAAVARRFSVVGGPQGNDIRTGTAPPSDPQHWSFVHQSSDVGRSLPARISVADARSS